MLLTDVWVAIELFVACRWSRSPWRIPLTAVRGVRTGKLEMVHHFASCKEQACQERYDAWASLDVDRSTTLTWLLLRRMPTRRWAPAHHRVGINGGQSPEQLYVTCARIYCLADPWWWSPKVTALLWTYSFMLTLSPPFPRWCFWCWCATCFVASLRRSSSPLLGSAKKKQLVYVQQECERQECEWHQCEARCRNANSANETKVWRSSVRMWAVQCEKKLWRKGHCDMHAFHCFIDKSPSSGIVKTICDSSTLTALPQLGKPNLTEFSLPKS